MDWSLLLSHRRIGKREKSGKNTVRSAFEQDYDRIVFSHPFRRMQDKTQVHPLPEHDFVHNRLTHSLETSSVGRSLGRKAGETVLQRQGKSSELDKFSPSDFGAIVAAASLAHDVGNPPFGHRGEQAISDFFVHYPQGKSFQSKVTKPQWQDIIQFEGNAQGFRILNKKQYRGLRLTYSTLGAFTKYPCASNTKDKGNKKYGQKKYGFFQTEQPLFNEIATSLQLTKIKTNVWARHPLAFLVEAADDICYSIIDLEDGCRLGLVSFKDTLELFAALLRDKFKPAELKRIYSRDEKIGRLRALAINQLVDECSSVFVDNEAKILGNKFDRTLTDCCPSSKVLKKIIKVSSDNIYSAHYALEIEVAGHTALVGLLEEFTLAGQRYIDNASLSDRHKMLIRLLPPEVKAEIEANRESSYHMLRSIMDFISGMTDHHALSLYGKIKAHALNRGNWR